MTFYFTKKGIVWEGRYFGELCPKGRKNSSRCLNGTSIKFRKLGVRVFLNMEATPSLAEELGPDVIVLAQGAEPIIPDVKGTYRENVVNAIDVLSGKAHVGERCVVVGGGMVGLETAEFLAEAEKKVAIVEMLSKIALDVGLTPRLAHWRKIPDLGIQIYTEAKLWEVHENGINVIMKLEQEHPERKGDEVFFLRADTVVLAVGMRPVRSQLEEWKSKAAQVFEVGDCVEPLEIVDAVHNGARLGLEI
jgi:2,4-dienoyl-CoA reductase (NADPH2)